MAQLDSFSAVHGAASDRMYFFCYRHTYSITIKIEARRRILGTMRYGDIELMASPTNDRLLLKKICANVRLAKSLR
jgi:hypothetical protein